MTSGFDISQYLNIFLDEADEQIQILDEAIVNLENDKKNSDLLNDIFRAAHTLKGSSASMGFEKMASVTHDLENVLDKLRQGEVEVTPEIIDLLLECLDIIKVLKEEIASEGKEGKTETEQLISKLKVVLDGTTVAKNEITVSFDAAGDEHIQLDDVEKGLVSEAYRKGYFVWHIRVTLDSDCMMKGPRAYIVFNNLESIGEIIKTVPSAEDIEAEKFENQFHLVLVSQEDKSNVESIIDSVSEIESIVIKPVSLEEDKLEETKEPEQKEDVEDKEATEEVSDDNNVRRLKTEKIKTSQTVRVDVQRLENLMNLVGELVIDRIRLADVGENLKNHLGTEGTLETLEEVSIHIGRITGELQEEIMKARMFPVEQVFNRFPRMVRDLARRAGKEINFQVVGRETELDRTVIEEIGDPLIHLLRNAIDHGIESPEKRRKLGKPAEGLVKLSASHQENQIVITVEDDGAGMDPEKIKAKAIEKGLINRENARRLTPKEAINLIFKPGFSTAKEISDVSGRGVGMDIVRNHIEKINGVIDIHSEVGKGTKFTIKLPLTLAINRSLLVKLEESVFAFPLSNVVEIINVEKDEIKHIHRQEVVMVRGEVLPLFTLEELLDIKRETPKRESFPVVVVKISEKPVGIIVDQLLGEQEIVIKSLGDYLGQVPGLAGATIMGDGKVALILDIRGLVQHARTEEYARIAN
ncbi:MAG: CheA signal transduction histidine kinase [Clostridiales bacterium]|nr:CheA signal transduction histidine kinase [Clostridiales bacterium]